MVYTLANKKVWVAGHRGMVGSAIVRRLSREDCQVITVGRDVLDLTNQMAVRSWIKHNRPDVVILAAAKVGGIFANNSFPADFIYDNLLIETNVLGAAYDVGVEKLLFLGSSCIYPKDAEQPIVEEALLTGPLEPTNEWYAIAKIAGIKLAQALRKQHGCDYISAMPTNLYGPGDNFDIVTSHVLPALLRKAHQAKVAKDQSITVWGSGTPRREFLHVDDCADACVHLLKVYSDLQHVNVGSGQDVTILDLTTLICDIVGFNGEITLDQTKPDGVPRKLMSSAKIHKLGWKPTITLRKGIEETYDWFTSHVA